MSLERRISRYEFCAKNSPVPIHDGLLPLVAEMLASFKWKAEAVYRLLVLVTLLHNMHRRVTHFEEIVQTIE